MAIFGFFSKLFSGDRPVRDCYHAMIEQSRRPELYGPNGMGIEDTLDGRFESLALHLAIIHAALEGEESLWPHRQKITEMLVSDLDNQFREIGISDSGIARKMTKLAEHLYGRIKAYTKGLNDGAEAMQAAVASNMTTQHSKRLAEYALAAFSKMQLAPEKSADLKWCRWPKEINQV